MPFPWVAAATIGAALIGAKARKKQQQKAHDFEKNRIPMTVRQARASGIHPLAALGAAGGYQNPYGGSSPMEVLGEGVAEAARHLPDRQDKENSNIRVKQARLLDAQILESRSRTVLNQANAHRAMVGPTSPHDPFAMRKENALVEVKLENGRRVLMPNPDLYEISPTELATGRVLLEGARAVSVADEKASGRKAKNVPWFLRGWFDDRGGQNAEVEDMESVGLVAPRGARGVVVAREGRATGRGNPGSVGTGW